MIYGSVDAQSAIILTVLALAAGAAIYVKRHWKELKLIPKEKEEKNRVIKNKII